MYDRYIIVNGDCPLRTYINTISATCTPGAVNMNHTLESLTEELNESTASLSVAVLENNMEKIKKEAKFIARIASVLLLMLEPEIESTDD